MAGTWKRDSRGLQATLVRSTLLAVALAAILICRGISEQTGRRYLGRSEEEVVGRLNRMMSGWANYFTLGQVAPAYKAVDRHAIRRLRQWS